MFHLQQNTHLEDVRCHLWREQQSSTSLFAWHAVGLIAYPRVLAAQLESLPLLFASQRNSRTGALADTRSLHTVELLVASLRGAKVQHQCRSATLTSCQQIAVPDDTQIWQPEARWGQYPSWTLASSNSSQGFATRTATKGDGVKLCCRPSFSCRAPVHACAPACALSSALIP